MQGQRDERRRLSWPKCYPAEGDSAIAELWAGEQLCADLQLTGIQLDQLGEDRVERCRTVLTLFPPASQSEFSPTGTSWEIDADEAIAQLQEARTSLLQNEKGRQPE